MNCFQRFVIILSISFLVNVFYGELITYSDLPSHFVVDSAYFGVDRDRFPLFQDLDNYEQDKLILEEIIPGVIITRDGDSNNE